MKFITKEDLNDVVQDSIKTYCLKKFNFETLPDELNSKLSSINFVDTLDCQDLTDEINGIIDIVSRVRA